MCVEQSDGQEVLLHQLEYSPTQYSLYVIPNSSLWAGLTLAVLTSSNHITHKNIGTLLFEHDRHFSLVLASKSEERNNNITTNSEEYSTPKCDTLLHNVSESGYSIYHSTSQLCHHDIISTEQIH